MYTHKYYNVFAKKKKKGYFKLVGRISNAILWRLFRNKVIIIAKLDNMATSYIHEELWKDIGGIVASFFISLGT